MNILESTKSKLSSHLQDLQKRYPVARLGLFGSIVRDDFDPERSDIDILVELNDEMNWDYFDLVWELEGLFPGRKVDVVSREAIQPHYWKFVEEDLQYV